MAAASRSVLAQRSPCWYESGPSARPARARQSSRPGGVHAIVSLLQDKVLAHILRWAAGAHLGVSRVEIATLAGGGDLASTSSLCPFFVAIVKRPPGPPASCAAAPTEVSAIVHVPRGFQAGGAPGTTATQRMPGGGGGAGGATIAERFGAELSALALVRADSDAVRSLLPLGPEQQGAGGGGTAERSVAGLQDAVHRIQWQWHLAHSLAVVSGTAHVSLDLWAAQPGAGQTASAEELVPIGSVTPAGVTPYALQAAEGMPLNVRPRYSAAIVDAGRSTASAASAAPRCAVLLVPQGREHEFSFAAREGQMSLARQAGVDRLILVVMQRGHRFASLAAVQKELSPAVLTMVPAASAAAAASSGGKGASIPFLAVADDLGERFVLAEGRSDLSGEYSVEDVPEDDNGSDDEEGDGDNSEGGGAATLSSPSPPPSAAATQVQRRRVLRRLVFMSNRGAIQSEALLRLSSDGSASVRLRLLRFPYHRGMAAALALAEPAATGGEYRVAVIGLGGGGLASYIAASGVACAEGWGRGARVTAVELDPAIVHVARTHFGLRVPSEPALLGAADAAGVAPGGTAGDGSVSVIVGDGLEFVKALGARASAGDNAGLLSALLIDVDAKDRDMTLGLSFPPKEFVSRAFLQSARAAIAPGGVLVVNLGARSKALFAGSLAAIEKEFGKGRVVTLRPSDGDSDDAGGGDLNRVVVAGGPTGGIAMATPDRAWSLFRSRRVAAALSIEIA
jgi:hypothetical protein